MNLTDLRDLYRHMEWADALVWRAVLASAEARANQKLREYLYHLHLVQWAWLRAWRCEPPDTPFPTFEDAPTLMLWGRSYYGQIAPHLDNLTDKKISETMQLPWADIVERELGRAPERTSTAETMLQIPLHSLYHRGQINMTLREVGGEPPGVDYIKWAWLGRPDANWDGVGQ